MNLMTSFLRAKQNLTYISLPLLASRCKGMAFIGLLASFSALTAQAHTTTTKTTSTPSVAIGGTATYTINANANGTTNAVVGLQLTDILPTGLTYSSTTSVTLNSAAIRTAVVNPLAGATTPTWGTFTNNAQTPAVPAVAITPAGAEQIVFNATVGPTTACGARTNNVIHSAGNVHT